MRACAALEIEQAARALLLSRHGGADKATIRMTFFR